VILMPKTNWLSEKRRRIEGADKALGALTGLLKQNFENAAELGAVLELKTPATARSRRDTPSTLKIGELVRICAAKDYACEIRLTRDGAETRIVL